MRLTHVCDMELVHEGVAVLVRPYGGEEGMVFGQGGGTVTGERLSGTARWANHAHRRSDGSMLPDVQGVIMTGDGAVVSFSMQGRTVWVNSAERVVGSQVLQVIFETEDERHRWLNNSVCVLEGLVSVPDRPGTGPRQLGLARVYACENELL
ncbi:MAG: DUF3237 family protein [Ktedonobacterales bacterium]